MEIDVITPDRAGVKDVVGDEIWRRSYDNSVTGRQAVQNDLDQELQDQIFSVWGDNPTVVYETGL